MLRPISQERFPQMSLEHAILGFLNYKPLSGYDLKALFDLSVKHFWPADQSQIYRTLSKLAESDFAEIEVVEQDERPDRKIYHITETGKEELHRWLLTPPPAKSDRVAELIQIFFAGQLNDEEALSILRHHADKTRNSLTTLERLTDCAKEYEGPPRDMFFWGLTLDYGISMKRASLVWVEDVIERIESGDYVKGDRDESISR